ncbi:helix-turn-helix domain-containing protein [Streptomyces pristinaespiralis]|nr:transcriptional regulator [Streptomyces pristinaespiralis]QMU18232.1 helix-turn-helix domain-containing protein [Streptomyces pristinaespiralis]
MDDAPEETKAFARKLSELRERSGRTYGSLARRVGVGASTLHRYCSGRTVPMEFAPVERLARICGCRGDELVALHRLWVLADAARGTRQERAARTGVPDKEGDAEAAGPEDDHDGEAPGPDDDGDAEAPGPDDGDAEAAGPEDDHDGEAPGPDDDGDAAGPDHDGDAEAAGPDDSDQQEDPEREQAAVRKSPAAEGTRLATASPLARRRSRRRAYAAVGAAVVVLALVLGFGGFTLGSGKQRTSTTQAEGGGPAAVRSAKSWPTPAAPPGPSASTSPTASATASPAPGAPGRPQGSGPGVVQNGAAGPSSPAPFTGTPFTWVTDDHVWRHGCGHAYFVDRSPADVPPPPVEADAEQWSRALQAGHAGETAVRVTVQGKGPEAVVLESLQVRVAARRTPEPRNVYRMDSGCGGSLTPRMFDVDLDMSRPVARSVAGNDAGEPIPAVSFPYRVSATDPEVLLVTGRTVRCDCEWYLQLRWSSGGRTGTVRIDDDGRPFRTSALADGAVHDYDYGSRRWVPSVPASRRP